MEILTFVSGFGSRQSLKQEFCVSLLGLTRLLFYTVVKRSVCRRCGLERLIGLLFYTVVKQLWLRPRLRQSLTRLLFYTVVKLAAVFDSFGHSLTRLLVYIEIKPPLYDKDQTSVSHYWVISQAMADKEKCQ